MSEANTIDGIPRKPVVAVAGAPGTGTTTLCVKLSESLSLPHTYAGALFRRMAQERGMSLAEFGAYAEAHHEVDSELDQRLIAVAKAGGVVLEGRMSAWHVKEAAVPALRILLTAPEDERARRVAGREEKPVEQVEKEIREREESERTRYRRIYGFDPGDERLYDVVVDTGGLTPDEVLAEVLKHVEGATF